MIASINEERVLYVGLQGNPSSSIWSTMNKPVTSLKTKRKSTLSKLFDSATTATSGGSSIWSSPPEPPHILLQASLSSSFAKPLAPLVESLRILKSPAELNLMNIAGQISGDAHAKMMRMVGNKECLTESQVEKSFSWVCGMRGSEREAYVPVVASG